MADNIEKLSQERLILNALPSIAIARFDEAQFFCEPRMRLLQRAFHDLRRHKDLWAAMGVMGAQAKKQANTAPYLGELLARAPLPRTTMHPHQNDQVRYALTLSNDLGQVIASMGSMQNAQQAPQQGLQWCDLGQPTLGTRLHLLDDAAWLFTPYDPIANVNSPICRVSMVVPQNSTERVACIVWRLQFPSATTHNRILEVAELGRWALRQPKYAPAVG